MRVFAYNLARIRNAVQTDVVVFVETVLRGWFVTLKGNAVSLLARGRNVETMDAEALVANVGKINIAMRQGNANHVHAKAKSADRTVVARDVDSQPVQRAKHAIWILVSVLHLHLIAFQRTHQAVKIVHVKSVFVK